MVVSDFEILVALAKMSLMMIGPLGDEKRRRGCHVGPWRSFFGLSLLSLFWSASLCDDGYCDWCWILATVVGLS
jgi:hypothetical protein